MQKVNLRQPVTSLTVLSTNQKLLNQLRIVQKYIQAELNVGEVFFDNDVDKFKIYKVRPNYKELRPLLEKLYGGEEDKNKKKGKEKGKEQQKGQEKGKGQQKGKKQKGKKKKKVKKALPPLIQEINKMNQDQDDIRLFVKNKKKTILDQEISYNQIIVSETYNTKALPKHQVIAECNNFSIILDKF